MIACLVVLLAQQVEPRVILTRLVTSTVVANTSGQPQAVTVGLYYPRSDGLTADTTRPVPAIVSPRQFALGSGQRQVVRLLVRGPVPKLARLLTCWTPTARPVGRVALISRLCLNALAMGGGP
jgi:P pilus assembly chaperone PapD